MNEITNSTAIGIAKSSVNKKAIKNQLQSQRKIDIDVPLSQKNQKLSTPYLQNNKIGKQSNIIENPALSFIRANSARKLASNIAKKESKLLMNPNIDDNIAKNVNLKK